MKNALNSLRKEKNRFRGFAGFSLCSEKSTIDREEQKTSFKFIIMFLFLCFILSFSLDASASITIDSFTKESSTDTTVTFAAIVSTGGGEKVSDYVVYVSDRGVSYISAYDQKSIVTTAKSMTLTFNKDNAHCKIDARLQVRGSKGTVVLSANIIQHNWLNCGPSYYMTNIGVPDEVVHLANGSTVTVYSSDTAYLQAPFAIGGTYSAPSLSFNPSVVDVNFDKRFYFGTLYFQTKDLSPMRYSYVCDNLFIPCDDRSLPAPYFWFKPFDDFYYGSWVPGSFYYGSGRAYWESIPSGSNNIFDSSFYIHVLFYYKQFIDNSCFGSYVSSSLIPPVRDSLNNEVRTDDAIRSMAMSCLSSVPSGQVAFFMYPQYNDNNCFYYQSLKPTDDGCKLSAYVPVSGGESKGVGGINRGFNRRSTGNRQGGIGGYEIQIFH